MVNGASPGPAPVAQARASNSRPTRSNYRLSTRLYDQNVWLPLATLKRTPSRLLKNPAWPFSAERTG